MRYYLHVALIRFENRFGFYRAFTWRWWLSRLVDWTCPAADTDDFCPYYKPQYEDE